jgi:acetamidase/formamidase
MNTRQILQPGTGPIRSSHYVAADESSIFWGRLPCGVDDAVLTVEPGSEVTIDTLSHEGVLEDQGRDPATFFAGFGVDRASVLDDAVRLASSTHPRDPAVDGPHVVTGPIGVRGAQPGDLLKITVVELLRRVPYGVISNRHGRGALPGEYPRGPGNVSIFAAVEEREEREERVGLDGGEGREGGPVGTMPRVAGGAHTIHFALAPFLGIMGVAVAGDVRPHSVPPGTHGGNIDINLLTEGSVLYLPVQVADALAYIGDPHFAQGDGEVSLTAMEASLRATLRFELVRQDDAVAAFGKLVGPLAETTEFLIPTGMNADLDLAVQDCVRAAIALLQARFGMDAEHAYAYLSAATDFNISQVVDLVKGVHARIRVEDFNEQ